MTVRIDPGVERAVLAAGRARTRPAVGSAAARVGVFAVTVVAAVLAATPVVLLAGSTPGRALSALVEGSWGSPVAVTETLVLATPLLLAGLAVAVGFHSGLFNIGVEGQIVMGGLVAGVLGVQLRGLPGWLVALCATLAAMAAGAAWTLVPALLKALRGVHEVVTTIMLNYVAIALSTWAVSPSGPFVSRTQPAATERLPAAARLPVLMEGTRLHAGILVALAAAAAVAWYLYRTPSGFRLRLVGANPGAARSAGASTARTIVRAFLVSGALAGLTGAVQVLGLYGRYFDGSSAGYGFDAIAVALLGALSPVGIAAAALFFATLDAGSVQLQAAAGISRELVAVISGLVVAFVVAQPWLLRLRERRRREER